MVARSEPEAVCSAMQGVVRNRSGLYKWQTHLAALRIIGQAGCMASCRTVANYRDTMSSADNYAKWVAIPGPQPSEYDKVSQQIATTFGQLTRVSGSQSCK
jgi:hypothetical protein